MRFHGADDPAEHLCGYDVHLVHQQQSPLPPPYGPHDLGRLVTALSTVRYHRVGRDEYATARGMYVVLDIGREDGYVIVGYVRPQFELVLPLQHRHGIGAKADDRFLDGLRGGDPREGLPGATGQDDDP